MGNKSLKISRGLTAGRFLATLCLAGCKIHGKNRKRVGKNREVKKIVPYYFMSTALIKTFCYVVKSHFKLQRLVNLPSVEVLSKRFTQSDPPPSWGSKKQHRKIKLNFGLNIMADPEVEKTLAPLRDAVKEQVSF